MFRPAGSNDKTWGSFLQFDKPCRAIALNFRPISVAHASLLAAAVVFEPRATKAPTSLP
jgi:hypothetical protein